MKSFKQQCIELRQKDYSLDEIVKITGHGKSTVYFHIKDIPLSAQKKHQISERTRQRARLNSANRKGKSSRAYKSFSNWTPELVLLIAHLMFDGELQKIRCRYHNRSSVLIERVESLMRLVYEYPAKKTTNNISGVTTVGFYNVALASYLHEQSQILISNIDTFSKEHQRSFLRAFFDDEGCMDYRISRNLRRVRGYQKDKRILKLIQSLLGQFDIESALKEPNEVVITGKENLKKFQNEINFSEGVRINPKRTNSIWKKDLEKRVLLYMAIESFKS